MKSGKKVESTKKNLDLILGGVITILSPQHSHLRSNKLDTHLYLVKVARRTVPSERLNFENGTILNVVWEMS